MVESHRSPLEGMDSDLAAAKGGEGADRLLEFDLEA